MREIKFRVWDADNKRYVEDTHHWFFTLKGSLYNDECDEFHAPFDDGFKLEQFTGLKDKDGVEIFEGDILSEPVSPVGGKDGGYLFKSREIKWEGASCGYDLHNPSAASEIIGNINQNPELLEL